MILYQEIRELYRYRELIKNLVIRDIKKRYKRSILGFLWVMLDPLLMMIVFYAVFVGIFGRTLDNYTAYVISGITMWQLFAQGTKISSIALISNRNLISKLYMPKSIFPLSVVVSSFVHFLFALIPLLLVIILSGTSISANVLFTPVAVFLIFFFSLGISLAVSTIAVFFHDAVYIYDVLLLAWMYLSAIFYPVSILPEKLQLLMYFNPVYHFITLFRGCLYDNKISLSEHMLYGLTFSLISFSLGWIIYKKNRERIVFYL